MLGKNTILKAIHNNFAELAQEVKVWMLGKNTILKAIHNNSASCPTRPEGVNAG